VTDPLPNVAPKDVLLVAGYPYSYFQGPMIEGMAVAAGVDLAGDEAQAGILEAMQVLSGRAQIALPAEGNLEIGGESYTGVIVQYQVPEGEEGHYVAFRLNEPRYQYTCFFRNIVTTGRAIVPAPNDDVNAECD